MAPKEKVNTKNKEKEEVLTRIAIVSDDRCKPKKCRQEVSKRERESSRRAADVVLALRGRRSVCAAPIAAAACGPRRRAPG
jgi:translation initiation factor RLI1